MRNSKGEFRPESKNTPNINELVELEARDGHKWLQFERELEQIDFGSKSMNLNGRENLLTLWENEFTYRGLGPLDARRKAENELRIVQAFRQALLDYKAYVRELNSIVSKERIRKQKLFKKIKNRLSLLMVGIGILAYFNDNYDLIIFLAIAFIVLQLITTYFSNRLSELNVQSLSSKRLTLIQEPIDSEISKKLSKVAAELVDLGKPELFDDSSMRELILNWSSRN